MIRRPPRSTLSLHDALPISPTFKSFTLLVACPFRNFCRSAPVRHRRDRKLKSRTPTVSRNARCSAGGSPRSEEHTSELQSRSDLVCRLLLEKKKKNRRRIDICSNSPHVNLLRCDRNSHAVLHTYIRIPTDQSAIYAKRLCQPFALHTCAQQD